MTKIGFDIGGTTIEYVVKKGNKQSKHKFLVNGISKDELLDKVASIINSISDKDVIVRIASPTAVDTKTGFCAGISGIKDYGNFNLYRELGKRLKNKEISIKALNDAKSGLKGIIEKEFKTKPHSVLMISLGTGIGGGLYLNGDIFPGFNNMAGEIGYPIWDGNKNISQSLSPVNFFKNSLGETDGKKIFGSHEKYLIKINAWLNDLSKMIVTYAFCVNPQFVVFTGGVTKDKVFQNLLLAAYDKFLIDNNLNGLLQTKIKFFNSSENYNIIGALSLK